MITVTVGINFYISILFMYPTISITKFIRVLPLSSPNKEAYFIKSNNLTLLALCKAFYNPIVFEISYSGPLVSHKPAVSTILKLGI